MLPSATSASSSFVAPTTDDFKTLTVTGDYVGNDGHWLFNRALGDDASLGDQLVIQGNRQALSDSGLVARLREHKPALVAMIEQGRYSDGNRTGSALPDNRIEGLSGSLSMNANQRIERQLPWAEFTGGQVKRLPDTPR